jgi:NitT/TauT family transport system substrate-binding protein
MSKRHFSRQLMQSLIVLLIAVLLLSACGSKKQSPQKTEAPTPVSIQMSWVDTMEFSGFYVAKEQGYYDRQNLDVTLKSGGFDADGNYISPIDQVATGAADFGIVSGDLLLLARADGKPLVAVATIYQPSPVVFLSLAEKNITRPQDLIGKTVGIDLNSATGIAYRALLASQNIPFEDVNTVPRTSADSSQLLNGDVDVLDGFVTNQPIILRREGYDINLILASDYGISVYSNAIFTTEDMIANHPDVIETFLRASFDGFSTALDDPQKATEIAKPYLAITYGQDFDIQNEVDVMRASVPLIRPADSQVGMMTADAWQVTQQILLDQGLLSAPLNIEATYNLTFLGKIYPK